MSPIALHPDPTAMDFDDPLDQGETNAGAFGPHIQFIEKTEDAFMIFRSNSHAIVHHVKDGLVLLVTR